MTAFSLRQYQVDDFISVRHLLREVDSVVYVLPTGGGKTVWAGTFAQRLRANGHTAACLVHRKEILDQFVNTMTMAGLSNDVGVIAPGYVPTPWAPIQVASVFSLLKRQLTIKPVVIFIDEAHHVRASTWEKVLAAYPNAKLVGMTATPRRYDGLGLGRHFEAMHIGPTVPELVALHHLAPMRTLSVPVGFVTVKRTDTNEFNQRELAAQVNEKIVAKSAQAYLKNALGKRALFFGTSVKHSELVAEELRSYGARAAHVDGKTTKALRTRTFEAFRQGQLDVVCNVDLVGEGFDVPDCEVVINARLTMSLARYEQAAGRGRRPYPGDPTREKLHIDCAGNFHFHGEPGTFTDWSLEDDEGIEAQKNVLKNPRGAALRTCKACATVFPPTERFCPSCGTEYPPGIEVNEQDVELEDVTGKGGGGAGRRNKKPRRSRKEINAALERARVHSRGGDFGEAWAIIAEFASESGYHPNWAHRMADIQKIPIRARGDVGL